MRPYIYIPIGTSIFLYLSKPSDDSFYAYLRSELANHPKAKQLDLAMVNIGIKYIIPIDIKDYGIIKTAHLTVSNPKETYNCYFVGTFQNWFLINASVNDRD